MFSRSSVKLAWDVVMNERRNPLRSFPLMTAHMLMQILAWMWSTIFAVAVFQRAEQAEPKAV